MKQGKDKVVRKRYMTGTSIRNIIEDPSTALAKNDINIAKAQYAGASNPFVIGLDMLGNLATQAGGALGGFENIEGINPNLAKVLNAGLPAITQGLQYLGNGGRIKSNVPVEVEGGEAGELPNGQVLKFNGPSHDNGGIPIDLPEGTEIYSKRIKIEGESMADRKLKRESILARYTKKANKLGDAISSNTLKRVQKSVDIQEEEDKKVQQLIHDMTTGVVNAGNQVMREKHAGGLTVKYPKQEDESLQLSNSLVPEVLAQPSYLFDTGKIKTPEVFPTKLPTPTPMTPDTNDYSTRYVEGASKLPFITGGDALNIAGNVFQGVAPYLNTLKQRATDTPNVNAFKNYGEEGINKMAQSENYLKQVFDSRLKDIGLKRSDAIKRGRNSTGSVNLMRALDTNADMAANTAENEIYDKYAAQMMDILSKEAQLENEQDKVVMSGEQARDLADRQDKDAFYTAKGEGLRNIGMTTANAGKQANEILTRNSQFNILNSMYENFGINPTTGQVYGKLAKAMNLKDGDIPTPSAIDAYIKSGVDPRIKTKEDYYKIYGLTNPNPINNITVGTKGKGGKE